MRTVEILSQALLFAGLASNIAAIYRRLMVRSPPVWEHVLWLLPPVLSVLVFLAYIVTPARAHWPAVLAGYTVAYLVANVLFWRMALRAHP